MGWVMAPATDAVVGAVPAARSGVASAMNTVARMVSGALGVAVIGSLVGSLYERDVESSLGALPAPAREAAGESIGAAGAIAGQLPPDAGASLMAAAADAFTGAMGIGPGRGRRAEHRHRGRRRARAAQPAPGPRARPRRARAGGLGSASVMARSAPGSGAAAPRRRRGPRGDAADTAAPCSTRRERASPSTATTGRSCATSPPTRTSTSRS